MALGLGLVVDVVLDLKDGSSTRRSFFQIDAIPSTCSLFTALASIEGKGTTQHFPPPYCDCADVEEDDDAPKNSRTFNGSVRPHSQLGESAFSRCNSHFPSRTSFIMRYVTVALISNGTCSSANFSVSTTFARETTLGWDSQLSLPRSVFEFHRSQSRIKSASLLSTEFLSS